MNEKFEKRNAMSVNKKKSIKNEITQLDIAINKLTDALIQSDNLESLTDKLKQLENKKIALNNKYEYYNNYKTDSVTSDEIDKVKKLFKNYLLNTEKRSSKSRSSDSSGAGSAFFSSFLGASAFLAT